MASGAASSSRTAPNMARVQPNTDGNGENGKPRPDITEIEDDDEEWISSEAESSEYDTDDPDDPVVKEYEVFITEPSENDLYIMQFIGRPVGKGPLVGKEAPTQMRVKPESGYFEVDVPLDIHDEHYDRRKGVELGEAVRKTKNLGQLGGYGPAVGFERSMPKTKKRSGSADEDPDADVEEPPPPPVDDNIDDYLKNFDDANEKGHVLNTTTWGGQVIGRQSWRPHYMVGTFRKDELHLTPVTGIVQLRPELHHMEAVKHLEIINDRKQPPDAKGVLPTLKKLTDEPSIADMLKGNANEKWTRMNWIPADSPAAREARENRLFLKDTVNAPRLETESAEDYMNRYVPVVVGKGRAKPKKKKDKDIVQKAPGLTAENAVDLTVEEEEEEEKGEEGPKGRRRRLRGRGGFRNSELAYRPRNWAFGGGGIQGWVDGWSSYAMISRQYNLLAAP